ncbi:Hsp20 family protein [Sulfitobacter donghicola]|uniref:Heat shock protein IbpA n=1 Tax=Sulfitobacter donghicola DSW-25 = KCTC 12864 = JCM 14565 TaxID=1300350 RepID=A0A073IMI7_9RHOB|nr:Hsp20 family protein [Sulfitobacter donghicola]KEJ90810.1 heat shock protein IbpA [Sulfitobacter donghicola DSW-25 = KCTC 12864 = JCM 14565]KIN68084.1 Heat shock protein, Hsp20 family [Sulfitobacter donghicola DSW-25 = KCTC 12864 = JCM 14565]
MRNFDFAPLYRSTVGFDQIANMMDRVLTTDNSQPSYPPYNIEKLENDAYRISIAVAGFSDADLSVEVREKSLIVSAKKADEDEGKSYLHRGIATRAFERRFHLADHVVVTGAAHTDGMLHIELERQVPDALKPRQIQIASERAQITKDVAGAKPVN